MNIGIFTRTREGLNRLVLVKNDVGIRTYCRIYNTGAMPTIFHSSETVTNYFQKCRKQSLEVLSKKFAHKS